MLFINAYIKALLPVVNVWFGWLDQGDVDGDPQHARPHRVHAH